LPLLTAYNKMDCVSESDRDLFRRRDGLLISASTGQGLESLLGAIELCFCIPT
jgi:50S ribosomal subunit-associated GTPase HflX